jgi:hypothetical protein
MRHNLWVPDRAKPLGRLLWASVALVAVLVLAYSAALRHQAAALHGTVSVAEIHLASLRVQVAQADARIAPFRQAAEIAAGLDREAADPGLLRRLEMAVPDDVWFIGVTLSRNTMGIDGRSLGLADIARTVMAIRGTPGIASAEVTVVTKSAEGWYTFHLVAEPQADQHGGAGGAQ